MDVVAWMFQRGRNSAVICKIVTVRMCPIIDGKERILSFKTQSKRNSHFIVNHAVRCSINSTHGIDTGRGSFIKTAAEISTGTREIHEVAKVGRELRVSTDQIFN